LVSSSFLGAMDKKEKIKYPDKDTKYFLKFDNELILVARQGLEYSNILSSAIDTDFYSKDALKKVYDDKNNKFIISMKQVLQGAKWKDNIEVADIKNLALILDGKLDLKEGHAQDFIPLMALVDFLNINSPKKEVLIKEVAMGKEETDEAYKEETDEAFEKYLNENLLVDINTKNIIFKEFPDFKKELKKEGSFVKEVEVIQIHGITLKDLYEEFSRKIKDQDYFDFFNEKGPFWELFQFDLDLIFKLMPSLDKNYLSFSDKHEQVKSLFSESNSEKVPLFDDAYIIASKGFFKIIENKKEIISLKLKDGKSAAQSFSLIKNGNIEAFLFVDDDDYDPELIVYDLFDLYGLYDDITYEQLMFVLIFKNKQKFIYKSPKMFNNFLKKFEKDKELQETYYFLPEKVKKFMNNMKWLEDINEIIEKIKSKSNDEEEEGEDDVDF
ncbi:hypothetical protein KAH94_04885, partial [bacterium]|nr:hypothetical protein [bacterium]